MRAARSHAQWSISLVEDAIVRWLAEIDAKLA
jgi:hypothetical protein